MFDSLGNGGLNETKFLAALSPPPSLSLSHNDFPPAYLSDEFHLPLAPCRPSKNLNLPREPLSGGMTPGTGPRQPLKDPTNSTRVVVRRTCRRDLVCVREGDVTSRRRVWLFRSNEIGFVTTGCVRCARLLSLSFLFSFIAFRDGYLHLCLCVDSDKITRRF